MIPFYRVLDFGRMSHDTRAGRRMLPPTTPSTIIPTTSHKTSRGENLELVYLTLIGNLRAFCLQGRSLTLLPVRWIIILSVAALYLFMFVRVVVLCERKNSLCFRDSGGHSTMARASHDVKNVFG